MDRFRTQLNSRHTSRGRRWIRIRGAVRAVRLSAPKFLLFARWGLFFSVVLFVLPWIALRDLPSLLEGLFHLTTGFQLVNVTWLSLMTAMALWAMLVVSGKHGAERVGWISAKRVAGPLERWLRMAFVLIVGFHTPVRAWWVSGATLLNFLNLVWGAAIAGIFVLFLRWLQRQVQESVRQHRGPELIQQSDNWLIRDREWPGYTRPDPDHPGKHRLLTGHVALAVGFWSLVILYLVLRQLTDNPQYLDQDASLCALFYVLALLLILAHVFGALAFWFDRYHIPAVAVLGLWIFVTYARNGTDHFFDLNPTSQSKPVPVAEGRAVVPLKDMLDDPKWNFPRGPDPENRRTLVVVTASGGGIQASAWTARVLTGLDEQFEGFSESVALVSAVSGGSTGTLFYVSGRGNRSGDVQAPMSIPEETRSQINTLSRRSSLEATGWGLISYDLVRLLSLFPVQKEIDRGLTVEQLWNQRLMSLTGAKDPPRIRDWAGAVREARMPAVVFNATAVETGQRVLISPVVRVPGQEPGKLEPVGVPVEFLRRFSQADPYAATAARLSATFSYVSPICRPLPENVPANLSPELQAKYQYHLADGGYTDNEGLVTALTWIRDLVVREFDRTPRKFDRVLIVRIIPFPDTLEPEIVGGNGLLHVFAGPVNTLGAARVASQEERGQIELAAILGALRDFQWDRLRAATPANSSTLDVAAAADVKQRFQRMGNARRAAANVSNRSDRDRIEKLLDRIIDVRVVRFQFNPRKGEIVPLSWKLTPQQIARIDESWENVGQRLRAAPQANPAPTPTDSIELEELQKWFRLRAKP